MTHVIRNFAAGPSILPREVVEQAAHDAVELDDVHLSVMEISHRSPFWANRMKEVEANTRALMKISDDYAVLYLQGGATAQFSMVPMNLAAVGERCDYILTGGWSQKAAAEAEKLGREVHIASSGEEGGFTALPQTHDLSDETAYVHYTANNTVRGTEFSELPEVGDRILVCDASSNILSRPLDVAKHGLIYAGAQKNLGPAGVTLVVVRRDLLERATWAKPTIFDYKLMAAKSSMYNTPPVWSIHVLGLTLEWIARQGGPEVIEARNIKKAAMLYEAIDQSAIFRGTAAEGSRSRMNVCFRASSDELEAKFVAEAAEVGLVTLKGHRSVGGMRASIYNAMPLEGVEELVAFMKDFEVRNG